MNDERYRIDDGSESSSESCNLVLDLSVHSKLCHQMHVTKEKNIFKIEIIKKYIKLADHFILWKVTRSSNNLKSYKIRIFAVFKPLAKRKEYLKERGWLEF